MKIASKISLSFFIAAVILTGIAAPIFYMTAKSNLKNAIFAHLRTTAQSRAKHIETYLEVHKEQIKALSELGEIENILSLGQNMEYLNKMLREVGKGEEHLCQLFVVNPQGIVIASSERESVGKDESSSLDISKAREEAYIGDTQLCEITGEGRIYLSAPIRDDKTKRLLGILVGCSEMAQLDKIVTHRTGLGRTGEIYLVNKYGYMITPSRSKKDTFLRQKVDTVNVKNCLMHKSKAHIPGRKEMIVFPGYRGVKVLGTHEYIPQMQWGLLAEIDEKEAFAPLAKIRRLFLIILLFVPIGAGVIGIFVSRIISRPVRKLHRGADIIATGNLDYRTNIKTDDEIGQLSRAFDKMTEDLRKTTTSITNLNKEIAERKRAEEEIKRLYEETKVLADRDPLTGLFNHRRINEILENEIERAKRGENVFSIMMLDVDDLKLINDAHGHIVGDKLLKDVATILKKSSRSVDSIGRYGGDEFLMVLPYTNGEKAKTIAKRISRKIQKDGLNINEEITIPTRLSIGVATYPFDSSVPQDLISLADKSMYDSKRLGRSVVSASAGEVSKFLTAEIPSFDVLQGLVAAVNSKDHYTKSHSDLVTNYALSLGEKTNLPSEEMEALRIAGLLHDIGKIGIPDSILRKPGPLERAEFEIVKQHPRLGATMLDGPLPPHQEHVLGAIMYHHERYDGKGYPGKLKGENIPLLARIIGIVDAYCAMITDRPYRKALTKDEAIAELREKAGTQFDPDLVPEFIECLKESES